MKYRISVDIESESYVEVVEVEAPDLTTAAFRAGFQLAHNRNPIGLMSVVKAEIPGGWVEVEL